MRKRLFITATLVLLFVLIGGMCVRADTPDFRNEPHLSVLLTSDAHLIVDGRPATLEQTEGAVDTLKRNGGTFWYARENGSQDPSAAQVKLFEALLDYAANARLPVRFFIDGTFTKLVPM
jgi:hypothetical protein